MRRRQAVEPAAETAELFEPAEKVDAAQEADSDAVSDSVQPRLHPPGEPADTDVTASLVDDDNLDTVPVTVVAADSPIDGPTEPVEPDVTLLGARNQARAALAEITDPESIGDDQGHEVHAAHVLTLFFACTHPGYPGWRWAATLARVDEHSAINVLEVELLPGPGSLTAPAWLPWSERLAQYHDAQMLQVESDDDDDEDDDEDDPDSDILVNDFSDFDDEIDGADVDGDDIEGETEGEAEDEVDEVDSHSHEESDDREQLEEE